MLDILHYNTLTVEQMEHVIYGMRNPMNSWDKSDSKKGNIGYNDFALMKKLAKAGTDHRKFMRMMPVWVTINAPLYWWKEFDTYKVGTVSNSCSTMHKITSKELTFSDFSCEDLPFKYVLSNLIIEINSLIERYNKTKDMKYFRAIIQLLPSSYNQKRTIMLNYEVLHNMYHSRRNHKLKEWHTFCDWIETLPLNELIIGE